jgi:hypothetical protein
MCDRDKQPDNRTYDTHGYGFPMDRLVQHSLVNRSQAADQPDRHCTIQRQPECSVFHLAQRIDLLFFWMLLLAFDNTSNVFHYCR